MKDSVYSMHREKMLETKFLSLIYEKTWVEENFNFMIGRVDIDNGIDLTIANSETTKLIQLKGKKQSNDSFSVIVDRELCLIDSFHLIFIMYEEMDGDIKYSYRMIMGEEIRSNCNLNPVYAVRNGDNVERKNKARINVSKEYSKTFDELYAKLI